MLQPKSSLAALHAMPDPPVKIATGRMRPSNEWRPSSGFLPSGLSTFKPCGLKPVQRGTETRAAIEKLVLNLNEHDAKAGGTGKIIQNNVRRACQQVLLPIDDVELTQTIRKLKTDNNGKLEIADVIGALSALAVKADEPSALVQRLWDPAPMSMLPPSKMLLAPTPSHSISAEDFAAIWHAKGMSRTRVPADVPMFGPGKRCYDMLPSIPGAVAHRSAEAQQRFIHDPSRSQIQNVNTLEVSCERKGPQRCRGELSAAPAILLAYALRLPFRHPLTRIALLTADRTMAVRPQQPRCSTREDRVRLRAAPRRGRGQRPASVVRAAQDLHAARAAHAHRLPPPHHTAESQCVKRHDQARQRAAPGAAARRIARALRVGNAIES